MSEKTLSVNDAVGLTELTEEQLMEGWEHFTSGEHFGKLSTLIDAKDFNAVFRKYPIHFVTNIPPEHRDVRIKNLEEAGFRFDSLHCGGFVSFDEEPPRTKAMIIQELVNEGEELFFIDDHPDNCTNVLDAFPEAMVWLMSRSHNKDFKHSQIQRADQWEEVFDFIRKFEK